MIKVKIISDGTRNGTKVVNAATGEEFDRVIAISWRADANDWSRIHCELLLEGVEVEIEDFATVTQRLHLKGTRIEVS